MLLLKWKKAVVKPVRFQSFKLNWPEKMEKCCTPLTFCWELLGRLCCQSSRRSLPLVSNISGPSPLAAETLGAQRCPRAPGRVAHGLRRRDGLDLPQLGR